jgi:hypothetical protein
MRSLIVITALSCLLPMTGAVSAAEHFSVKEYNKFHDLLEPLQHEALPNKDFQRIRSNAAEFVKRGKALVKVGVPAGTAKINVEKFRLELRKFNAALNKFSKDSKGKDDSKLEASFSVVHDSFEMLAGMLPPK